MGIIETLLLARSKNASDIHIVSNEQVVFRINGKIIKSNFCIDENEIILFIKSNWENLYKQFLISKELDIAYEDISNSRYRINFHIINKKIAMSIRLLQNEIPNFDKLNLPDVIKTQLDNTQGIILVTGATGSGKSTTLAAMIEEINISKELNIITIEDPIEYKFKSKKSFIRQRELGEDTNSFTNALKSVLRQDPDVVLVGEIRDLESIKMAITIAETGHLLLATLHTTNAPDTINRIIDVFPANEQNQIRIQLSNLLKCIINQKLLLGNDDKMHVACEIMINNTAITNYILTNKINQIPSVMDTNKKIGMCTMKKALEEMKNKKIISIETYEKELKCI